ncbi:dipeptide ABC transporter ATP-binding protein [Corynebacterium mendelii]|uniref:ABC transporter ATP-binding protein n=1 Tax=Corynebacterium mendelii TaxID=2765362 RepID=A0A939E1S0_9CORY|nr:ABC transporter ATP-binding protein [Corynebacterium mendelii]MBN9644208.1 ABC transporter ATP-binding protein [Corynebacterium mendelii]
MSDLLTVTNLSVTTRTGEPICRNLTFSIGRGERVGLIGESGSGKSVTALSIMDLLPEGLDDSGEITLHGLDGNIVDSPDRITRTIRGKRISMVFQEPMTALNPLMTIGDQIAEVMVHHHTVRGRKQAVEKTIRILTDVQLARAADAFSIYPHQLSGGQRQRVLIAMALANDPDLLICDEPTTALDVTVQRQIVDLIIALVDKHRTGLLFITHDLGLVNHVCQRVLVMRGGEIVERGPIGQILTRPTHTYTKGLLAASDLAARDRNGHLFTVDSAGDSYVPGTALAQPDFPAEGAPVLTATGISKTFRVRRGLFGRKKPPVEALSPTTITLNEGQRLGIVGGSGSGKTTLLKLLAGLQTPTTGTITVSGHTITDGRGGLNKTELIKAHACMQMVFQDPMSSLNPRMTVGDIVAEPLVGVAGLDPADKTRRVTEVLGEVGIDPEAVNRFPHEFSGGQRQRISIARALSVRPRILLADEPVSALDVSVRAQVLNLMTDVLVNHNLAMIFVSHDLAVIRQMCSGVIVLNNGAIVEQGPVEQVWNNPRSPFTRTLLEAVPRVTDTAGDQGA